MTIRISLCAAVSAAAFLLSAVSVPGEIRSEDMQLAQGKGKGKGGPPPWAGRGRGGPPPWTGRGRGGPDWNHGPWGPAHQRDWDRFFDRDFGRGGPSPWTGRRGGPLDWVRSRGMWDGQSWHHRDGRHPWFGRGHEFGRLDYGYRPFDYGYRPRLFDHGFSHYQPIYQRPYGW